MESLLLGGEIMDFSFALNKDFLIFIMIFVVLYAWQIAKMVRPKFFNPEIGDPQALEIQKQKVAQIILMVNLGIAVIYGIVLMALGYADNFWTILTDIGAIFTAGSVFDFAKAFKIIKS